MPRLRSFRLAPRAGQFVLFASALLMAGCADQEASYVGARSLDPALQSGLGNPDRDRPVVVTPPSPRQGEIEQRYQWNGNPQRVIQGKPASSDAKAPMLKPQPPSIATAGSGAGSGPDDAQVVEVQPGDTLHGIAQRYGVTVASLNQANRLSGAPLKAGQRLVLPPVAR